MMQIWIQKKLVMDGTPIVTSGTLTVANGQFWEKRRLFLVYNGFEFGSFSFGNRNNNTLDLKI